MELIKQILKVFQSNSTDFICKPYKMLHHLQIYPKVSIPCRRINHVDANLTFENQLRLL